MSVVPQSINAKSSSQNSKAPKNKPEAYWIVYQPSQKCENSPELKTLNTHDHTTPSKSQGNQSSNETIPNVQKYDFGSSQVIKESSKSKIVGILKKISKQYATYRFLNHLDGEMDQEKVHQIIEEMQKEFSKFKMTKRNLVFAILIPSINQRSQQQICSTAYFSKMIKFYSQNSSLPSSQQTHRELSPQNSPTKKLKISRKSSIIMGNHVFVSLQKSEEEIQQELIKQMKLDFIWLGVMSRLGTDVQRFQQVIIEDQDFSPEYIGFYDIFFEELNKLVYEEISKRQPNTTQQKHEIEPFLLQKFLEASKQAASKKNAEISVSIEQLIRSKFNSRVLISDIVTTGDYLPLLFSRNYFNLLYIQSNTLTRYNQFKKQCQQNYEELQKILTLQVFLTIDDYWYSQFIMKSLHHVKFIIDKGDQVGSFSEVINKNYRQIISSYRPNFDEYFISICNVLKERSGCLKQAVGAIIVKDKRIIATGYNGTAVDCVNCFNGGCKVCNNSEKMNTEVLSCTCIHAEYGCILEAGIKITPGSTLYSTKMPCLWCCKLIIQGQISKIVYLKSQSPHLQFQNIALARQILIKSNVELVEVDQSKIYISV